MEVENNSFGKNRVDEMTQTFRRACSRAATARVEGTTNGSAGVCE